MINLTESSQVTIFRWIHQILYLRFYQLILQTSTNTHTCTHWLLILDKINGKVYYLFAQEKKNKVYLNSFLHKGYT